MSIDSQGSKHRTLSSSAYQHTLHQDSLLNVSLSDLAVETNLPLRE